MRGAVGIGLACWGSAAVLHGVVPREPVALEVPSAPVLAALTAGRTTTGATLAWSATVLHAGNVRAPDAAAVRAGIDTALALDPGLRPPAAQGALILHRLGRDDLAIEVLDAGIARWPDEAWFPWARGMIAP